MIADMLRLQKKGQQGAEFNGRPIDVHYSLPKDEEDQTVDDKNNGTLFVSVRNSSNHIKNSDMFSYFSQWGQVREVRDCRNSPTQKFVEYYDLRESEKAFNNANGKDFYKQGILDIKYAFVQSNSTRDEQRRRKGRDEEEEEKSIGPVRTRERRGRDDEYEPNVEETPPADSNDQMQQQIIYQMAALAQLIQQQQAVSNIQPVYNPNMYIMPNQSTTQQSIAPLVYPQQQQQQQQQQQLTPQQLQQLVGMMSPNSYTTSMNPKQ